MYSSGHGNEYSAPFVLLCCFHLVNTSAVLDYQLAVLLVIFNLYHLLDSRLELGAERGFRQCMLRQLVVLALASF